MLAGRFERTHLPYRHIKNKKIKIAKKLSVVAWHKVSL